MDNWAVEQKQDYGQAQPGGVKLPLLNDDESEPNENLFAIFFHYFEQQTTTTVME